ncbi:MAG: antibiotic biosynthesis monooxygenase [Proteobacteria bacterium]|nr:antibiotic biosynthesis monooxygenase [Pseudomonadota bacterium]
MSQHTFVNKLSVPPSRRDEFLEKWDRGAEYVKNQPGLVWTSLHESVQTSDRLTFFTIAVWESANAFRNAVSSTWWQSFVDEFGFGDDPDGFRAAPDLCQVVRAGGPFQPGDAADDGEQRG